MSRNGSGTFTQALPAVVAGDTIESSWANTTIDDIETEMTDSLSRSGKGGMLAALKLADGTVSACGLAWSNETNSGLYRAGAGDVRMAVLGNDYWKVTALGLQMYVSASWVTPLTSSTGVAVTGDQTVAGVKTFSSDPIIPDEAYGVGWNGVLEPATKNAIYDKIETLPTNSTAVLVTGDQTVAGVKTFSDHVTMAAAKGLDLSANAGTAATGAATTSEVLTRYETGTWTPNLWDSSESSSEGQTYSDRNGFFTRIGNMVFITGDITLNGLGTLAGGDQARIGPLPYTASGIAPYAAGGVKTTKTTSLGLSAAASIVGTIDGSTNSIKLFKESATTGTSNLTVTEADGLIYFYGHYFV